MTIKNKRKNQKKYWNSYKGQHSNWKRFIQEQEYRLMYGNITKLQLETKKIVLSQLIKEITNEYKS